MDPTEIQARIRDPRVDYTAQALDESVFDTDPARQFLRWYAAASEGGAAEPNAMTLCTVDSDGAPDARIVLLRGFGEEGFQFFTSGTSAKGLQIAEGSRAALVFYWEAQHRQVRVRGTVDRLPDDEAAAYWSTRPRGSQVAAWASRQSAVIDSREALEKSFREAEQRFEGAAEVPVPPDWTGYCVKPDSVEFWQGREFRLHDRIRYRREGGGWVRERLAP